jgi:hypothetical protein
MGRWDDWHDIETAQAKADRPQLRVVRPQRDADESPGPVGATETPVLASPRVITPPERPKVDDARGYRLLAKQLRAMLENTR